jgi:flagellar protein FliO/FliZ
MDANLAAGGAVAPTGTAGLASVMLSLLLVIGLAWLVSRLRGMATGGAAGPLRVAAAASLGMKERLVLVDAAGAWLLLSVAPGRIEVLHRYAQRPEGLDVEAAPPGFAALLSRMKKGGSAP